MENERGRQEVLMALQGVGRLGIMMDPVFKLTAAGTILLIQHFARMYKEGLLNRREFQNFQEFAKLTEGNYQIINIPVGSWKELEKTGFVHQMEGVRKSRICHPNGRARGSVCRTAGFESGRWTCTGGNLWRR